MKAKKSSLLSIVDTISIESPCGQNVTIAEGETKGYCGACDKYVHDISQYTRLETGLLLIATKGQCCVRLRRDTANQVKFAEYGDHLPSMQPLRNAAVVAAGFIAPLTITMDGLAETPKQECGADSKGSKASILSNSQISSPYSGDRNSPPGETATSQEALKLATEYYDGGVHVNSLGPQINYYLGKSGFYVGLISGTASVVLATSRRLRKYGWRVIALAVALFLVAGFHFGMRYLLDAFLIPQV
jgi:hypothetical protein